MLPFSEQISRAKIVLKGLKTPRFAGLTLSTTLFLRLYLEHSR
jgi:hypothetical protein